MSKMLCDSFLQWNYGRDGKIWGKILSTMKNGARMRCFAQGTATIFQRKTLLIARACLL